MFSAAAARRAGARGRADEGERARRAGLRRAVEPRLQVAPPASPLTPCHDDPSIRRRPARQGRARHRRELGHRRRGRARLRLLGHAGGGALPLEARRGRGRWSRASATAAATPKPSPPRPRTAPAWQRLAVDARERFGRIDVLVNNAGGFVRRVPLAEADDAIIDEVFQQNARSMMALSRARHPVHARGRRRLDHQRHLAGGAQRRQLRRRRLFGDQGLRVDLHAGARQGAGRRPDPGQRRLARRHRHADPRGPHQPRRC